MIVDDVPKMYGTALDFIPTVLAGVNITWI